MGIGEEEKPAILGLHHGSGAGRRGKLVEESGGTLTKRANGVSTEGRKGVVAAWGEDKFGGVLVGFPTFREVGCFVLRSS